MMVETSRLPPSGPRRLSSPFSRSSDIGEDGRIIQGDRTWRTRAASRESNLKIFLARFTMKALVAAATAGQALRYQCAAREVRTEANGFPKHEQLQKIVGQYQHQHGEREQGDIAEEARVSRLACI